MQTKFLLVPLRILPSLFLLYSCTSSTCSKTVSCPGYKDPSLDAWFPYNDNQELIFKNAGNVYDTFSLSLQDSTVAYTYMTGGFDQPAPRGCNSNKVLSSTQTDSGNYDYSLFSITLSGALPSYSTTLGSSISLSFSGNDFSCSSLTDTGFSSFNVSQPNGMLSNIVTSQVLYNYSLGGKIYSLAQSVIADTSVPKYDSGVYKIIYAKNVGIIEYETNPGNVIWVKQ